MLSQAEAVWTKVPFSKICPKNLVAKCWEETGIWEIIVSNEDADELGQGQGRCSLKFCSWEMLFGLHFSSRVEKYSPRSLRGGEFRNLLTGYLPLFWSFISWSIAQPFFGCEGVVLGRQPPRCVGICSVQRQKEFKKTPLLWATQCALMKLLTELYTTCST